MIDSYVAKSYFGERKTGVYRSNKVKENHSFRQYDLGTLITLKNPVLSCEEVCDALKINEIGK